MYKFDSTEYIWTYAKFIDTLTKKKLYQPGVCFYDSINSV